MPHRFRLSPAGTALPVAAEAGAAAGQSQQVSAGSPASEASFGALSYQLRLILRAWPEKSDIGWPTRWAIWRWRCKPKKAPPTSSAPSSTRQRTSCPVRGGQASRGCRGAGVVAEVPTDPVVAKLDELQSELYDGPCLTALREHHTVHIDDMSAEIRWPQFTRQATELGVHSLLSFQLFVRSENLGALHLYGGEAGVFTDDSVEVGTILAQHAAVAMVGATAETIFQPRWPVATSWQAKGILMHRDHLTGLQAFTMLIRASKDTNIKLVDVARWLVEEHEDRITRA
jgi:GAF domain-containing protein